MLNTKFNYSYILCIIINIVIIVSLCIILYKWFNDFHSYSSIDKVLYINLENRRDRRNLLHQELQKLNIPSSKIVRIEGVYKPKNGHKGCVQSHIKALEMAKSKGWKRVLILEDDFEAALEPSEFKKQLKTMLNALEKSVREWNVIMLATFKFVKKDSNIHPEIMKINEAQSASAYIVNKNYVDILLDTFRKSDEQLKEDKITEDNGTEPYALDMMWKPLQRRDEWYGFKNDISKQRSISSTIVDNYHQYQNPKTKHKYRNKELFQNINTGIELEKIPKQIHQVWVGSNPNELPIHKKKFMSSYKMVLPNEWQYRLWTDADITNENFPLTFEFIQKIRMKPKKQSQIADLMKFEIIYNHGGFYFDTNIELLKDLSFLVDSNNYQMIVCNEVDALTDYMSCGFLAGVPKNKYLARIMNKEILQSINFESPNANIESGPYFFKKCFTDYEFQTAEISHILILPTNQIYPIHPGEPQKDKCIVYDTTSNHNISSSSVYSTMKKDKEVKFLFPCLEFPNSLAIDHFFFGCSWC